MKKIIFCFIILFIFIGVRAETFSINTKLVDHTIRVSNGINTYDSVLYIIKRSNGDPVYCLNPYKLLDTNDVYNEYDYNNSVFNLSNETLNKINLIAYYGYGYPGHYEDKWYGVTQFLIWKNLGIGDAYYTNGVGGLEVLKFTDEINELEILVDKYLLRPTFFNSYLEYDLNREYIINDSTGFINNYEIESALDVYVENNKLHINTSNEEGVFEVKFKKRSLTNKNYLLYNFDGAQSLIYPGRFDIEYTMYVEVANRSIEIHKQDSEGIKRTNATLEGAIYELYNNVGKIDTLVTDSNGIARRGNLPKGDYYIKEITPSLGYNLDYNYYHVYLDKNNHNAIINSYEDVIKGYLNIKKYYGDDNIYQYEDGAVFEIYDSNNNYFDSITTVDGIAFIELPYGEYTIKQVNSIDGYKKVDDFKVNIEKNTKYYFDLYNIKEKKEEVEPLKQEILEVNVPNTGRNDYTYFISNLFIIIGIIFIIIGKKVTLLK